MYDDDTNEFSLILSFSIDTDGYSDRDREMFVSGYEFAEIAAHLERSRAGIDRPIHRENESRIRIACGRFKRACAITPTDEEIDQDGTWSRLEVPAI